MKTRLTAWLLSLLMVLSMLPSAAYAAEGPAVQPVPPDNDLTTVDTPMTVDNDPATVDDSTTAATGTLEAVYWGGDGCNDSNSGTAAEQAVASFEKVQELLAPNGTIYLCDTITVTGEFTLENLNFSRGADFYVMFWVEGDAELTLKNVTIDGNKGREHTKQDIMVYVKSGGTLNIEEGTKLINNDFTAIKAYSENSEKPSVINMKGGEISGNTGGNNWLGGGIVVDYNSEFNMSGGTICNNTAGSDDGNGGGVMVFGKANLTGGKITGNSAAVGGGLAVLNCGQVTLDGTEISGNTSSGAGGGVYVEGYPNNNNSQPLSTCSFEMKSGSITNNTAGEGYVAGGIFGNYWGLPTTLKISGGTISGNKSGEQSTSGRGAAIALGGKESDSSSPNYAQLELSGSPDIGGDVRLINYTDYTDEQNPVLKVPVKIKVTGDFTPANPVRLSTANSSGDSYHAVECADGVTLKGDMFLPSEPGAKFDGDGNLSSLYEGYINDMILKIGADQKPEDASFYYPNLTDAILPLKDPVTGNTHQVEVGGTLKLMGIDTKESITVSSGQNFTIDLNGHTMYPTTDFENNTWGPIITVKSGGTLHLADSSEGRSGKLSDWKNIVVEDGAKLLVYKQIDEVCCVAAGNEYSIRPEHTEVTDTAVAPTCTTAGKTEGKHCSVCNAVLKAQEEVPAKHTEVTIPRVEPTYESTGLILITYKTL